MPEMYFLLLLASRGIAFAPQPYTLEQCHKAGLAYSEFSLDHRCIPAPKDDYHDCLTSLYPNPFDQNTSVVITTNCEPSVSGKR